MRLIDADEIIYESDIFDCYPDRCDRFCSQCNKGIARRRRIVNMPTVDAVVIPEGATNGDMIKAMFDITDDDIDEGLSTTYVYTKTRVLKGSSQDYLRERITFNRDWWNAPYEKGEQECN